MFWNVADRSLNGFESCCKVVIDSGSCQPVL